MLVLSRKATQQLRLGESILVTVLEINGDKVKIGIEAPRDITILREELDTSAVPYILTLPIAQKEAERRAA
jgi:carbon storage regulator